MKTLDAVPVPQIAASFKKTFKILHPEPNVLLQGAHHAQTGGEGQYGEKPSTTNAFEPAML